MDLGLPLITTSEDSNPLGMTKRLLTRSLEMGTEASPFLDPDNMLEEACRRFADLPLGLVIVLGIMLLSLIDSLIVDIIEIVNTS